MSPFNRVPRRKRVRDGAVIAILTASTFLGGSEAVFAQTYPSAPSGQAAAGDKQRFFVKIAAGSLEDALARFTSQTHIRIVSAPGALAGLQSPGATGSLTAAEALGALLAGSGLSYSFTSVNVVAVAKAPAANGAITLPAVQVQGAASSAPADANPYADPSAPYKADRLSSSKFTENVLNTPRTATILTKEVLDDKNATSLREVGRSTAGVTLGSGEGGNAFGDRFFIRGFDARNDVFVDGVRDPGVSIRENFDTEQVEILRGPASSYAGRGTTGGAINIATKQAGPVDFYDMELSGGFNDGTKRVTFDVNKALSSKFDLRVNGLTQTANVAGRSFTNDNRDGIAANFVYRPSEKFTVTANYSHTSIYGLPDFGVPYDQVTKVPVTEAVVPRSTYYGIVNRDFTKSTQNLATLDAEWKVTSWLTLENKIRQGDSLLNYIGTIPENPSATGATAPYSSNANFFSGYTQLNAQSRYEPVQVLNDQPQATLTFDTGSVHHTAVLGGEFSDEHISIDTYSGFTSELTTGPVAFTSSGAPIVSVTSPTNYLYGTGVAKLTGNPLRYEVKTNAGYFMDTAHLSDAVILNGGVRYDDYRIGAANNTSSRSAQSGITSYNVGLVVKPTKAGSIYVAYATSADPVGDELDATSSSYGGLSPTQNATQIFGPQLSRSVEAGTKWELFDRHLLATFAVFQTNVTNARETAPANLPGFTSGQVVAGAAYRVRGIDLELAGKITERWSIMGGLVSMSPYITKSIVPTNVGLQLANIAPQSANLLTKYQITRRFELGGQASYASAIKGGSLLAANGGVAYPNPPNPTLLPSHWRFDTFAETYLGAHTELKLNVTNVFNKTYYDSLYQSAQPFIVVAPGRSVSLVGTLKM